MPRCAVAACLMLSMMFASTAGATVGDDDRLELLGWEPVDGKLYYLLHIGGLGDEPRLHFLPLRAGEPGEPRMVQSWYRGDARAVAQAFPGRLAELKARLKPLPDRALDGARLVVEHGPLRICPSAPVKPKDAAARAAVLARGEGADPETPVCRVLEVKVSWRGFGAEAKVDAWGGVTLLGVWPLPDERFALAVIRYTGKHFETGYAVEVPLLLRRAGEGG